MCIHSDTKAYGHGDRQHHNPILSISSPCVLPRDSHLDYSRRLWREICDSFTLDAAPTHKQLDSDLVDRFENPYSYPSYRLFNGSGWYPILTGNYLNLQPESTTRSDVQRTFRCSLT